MDEIAWKCPQCGSQKTEGRKRCADQKWPPVCDRCNTEMQKDWYAMNHSVHFVGEGFTRSHA